MKINKAELQNALEKVKSGLANKEIIEQSTSFAFMQNKVVTYNDEISISHPVSDLDVTGAVKAQELYQFLSKINKDEIDIEWADNQVKITAGKSKAGLIFQEEIKLPIDEVGGIGDWQSLPATFIDALKFCRTSCSKDMNRPVLTCIHIRQDGFVEASDGYRVTRYDLDDKLPIETFLIPASSVNELIKYDITQVAEGSGWVHFKTEDNTVFSCRVFQDNYPEADEVLKVEGKDINLPKNLSEALDRAQIFTKTDFSYDSLVALNIDDKKLTISAEADSGWFEETVNIRYEDDPISFKANPDFLSDMASRMQNCIVGEDRLKFQADDWVHVMALTSEE